MFSWLGDILGMLGESISSVIFDTMLRWFYDTIYGAAAAFLAQIGSLGTEIFDLDWVQAFVRLFSLLAWALYATGVVVAVFDVAIEYQTGRANLKTTALNVLKGFFACSLIGELPIALYKFCIESKTDVDPRKPGSCHDEDGLQVEPGKTLSLSQTRRLSLPRIQHSSIRS